MYLPAQILEETIMRIALATLSNSSRATVFHPVCRRPDVLASLLEPMDTFEPSSMEDDIERTATPVPDATPKPAAAATVQRQGDDRGSYTRTRKTTKELDGPSDARLITAGAWDAIRVKRFSTSSPVVAEAQRHLGLRYAWKGTDLRSGVDCSGFAYQVYRRSGRHVPLSWFREAFIDARRTPKLLERHGMKHVKTPQPGDVVVFGTRHVGIYAGEVRGQGLYIGANHGGASRVGRVDIQTVASYYKMQPVYYRYAPKKMRAASPDVRSKTVRTPSVTSPPVTSVTPGVPSSTARTR